VVVERSPGDADGVQDVVRAGAVEPLLPEEAVRRVEYLRAPFFRILDYPHGVSPL
jgi:hypothetical protein